MKQFSSLVVGFAVAFLCSMIATAAPLPGVDALAKPTLGLYASPLGFSISAQKTDWTQVKPPNGSKYIVAMFAAPHKDHNVQPSLTVRVDKLPAAKTLHSYVQNWLKEYPKYGFNVLGSKRFENNHLVGYAIDLVSPKSKRALRQVVFMKNKQAVIITCRDHKTNFDHTLKSCDKIIRSFSWNNLNTMDSKKL